MEESECTEKFELERLSVEGTELDQSAGREIFLSVQRETVIERESGFREFSSVPIDIDRIDRLFRPRAPVSDRWSDREPTVPKIREPNVRRSVRERPSDRSVTVRTSVRDRSVYRRESDSRLTD
ncbi:unnamed protein product [Microthlaspi erraticum]|uniref:Uncharacterized protein n=1 Tax=Microthlaspi erraticum TaxID=1685480 RepID=A0A6D2HS80_9BRAS|nr:unnamed protein product [Microthlaspi erraticum]